MLELPLRYQKAIAQLQKLSSFPEYEAAFIFGSAARNEVTENSDLDVRVIVTNKKTCESVGHPFVNSIKLDISFNSWKEFEKITNDELSFSKRITFIAESIIIFDKTGRLTTLKSKALKTQPKALTKKKHYWIQFMVYHATNKAQRFLQSHPINTLYSLHSNIGEILKFHYQLNHRWWVSDKRILSDLRQWDPPLATLLEKFVSSSRAKTKFSYWQSITQHILQPIGGLPSIADINCNCSICQRHLKNINHIKN